MPDQDLEVLTLGERYALAEKKFSDHLNYFACRGICVVRQDRNRAYEAYTKRPHPTSIRKGLPIAAKDVCRDVPRDAGGEICL